MKKYKRRTPLVPPFNLAIAVLYAAIATMIIVIFLGIDNKWSIICGGITATLLICCLFVVIATGTRYRYSYECIEVFFKSLLYKRIDYSSFSAVLISNASYNNNGYGYGVYGNIPMQYKVRENNSYKRVTLPFITLHKPQYPVEKVKPRMSSRDLFMLNNDEIYCLGICWFDSFQELLKRTNCTVYVLEDVYLRFEEQFDVTFSLHKNLDRFYIITDRIITYQAYKKRTNRGNTGDGSAC